MNRPFAEFFRILLLVASRWGVYLLMIGGLSLSLLAAIVIGLFVSDELTADRVFPNAAQIFLLSADYGPQHRPLVSSDVTPSGEGRWLGKDVAQIAKVSRLDPVEWPMMSAHRKARERFYWADANIFDVLRLPVAAGDLKTALVEPGTVVMTQRMARAYFGSENAIGQTVTTKNGIPLRLTAVLRDLPPNIHLAADIFASGTTKDSMLSFLDSQDILLWPTCYTYVLLKPGASVSAVQHDILDVTQRHWQGPNNLPVGFNLIPLLQLHFSPRGDGEIKPRGHFDAVVALIFVGILIVCLGCINFAGLVLAETNERGSEMVIRTALGARRIDLIAHVLGEALIVFLVSLLLALAAAERLLPPLNHVLELDLRLWSHAGVFVPVAVVAVLIAALLSGIYPAFVVSRPASAFRNDNDPPSRHASPERWRGWVVAQLTLVIVLLIAAYTMHAQWTLATGRALRFDGDDVLMVRFGDEPGPNAEFSARVKLLPGVEGAAQSFGAPTTEFVRPGWINMPGGRLVAFTRNSVEPDFFRIYKVPILAGRNLSGTFLTPEMPKEILVNESAVHSLGFARPADAIGHEMVYDTDRTKMRSRIVGVVPDIRFATVYEPMQPVIFDGFDKYFTQLNVRLKPGQIDRTTAEIARLWNTETGGAIPVKQTFYRDYLEGQYHDLHQQIQVFNLLSYVAIVLSMFGLTGLCVLLTRHQIREIAIRRALGARFFDIVSERLMPFFPPLILANLIAWPAAWIFLRYWLSAYAEHAPISITPFVATGAICVTVTLLTVAANSALSARRSHVAALRHE